MVNRKRITRAVSGSTPDEMSDEIQETIQEVEKKMPVFNVEVTAFVDQYGAKDDGWYRAVIVMEVDNGK